MATLTVLTEDTAALRTELQRLLLERSFTFGDFVLSSGQRSTFYFDGKQVTLEGRGLLLVSTLILRRSRELGATAVGGLTLGADPLAAGVVTLSALDGGEPLAGFIVRKATKEHGTGKVIEGPLLNASSRVVVLDDVVTTGGATLQAVERIRETGATILESITVVDRQQGGREALEAVGVPFHPLFTRSDFPGTAASA